jgi:branched-chain amino acid transport system ATP-binding protein
MAAPLLEIEGLRVKYGNVEALHGIDLEVHQGEIVTILGANGAGKSTTLRAISGLLRPSGGAIRFEGKPAHTVPAHELVRRGIAQAPEGRRIFGTLTVHENLMLGAFTRTDKAKIEETLAWIDRLFPVLEKRREQLAGTLSGGEQQMLAIGRALMASPRVLLLDEPSLGLAPLLVKTIFQTIREINQAGVTIVLVEQNARAALKLAHRGYVMEVGRIVLEDSAKALVADPKVQSAYLGGRR